MRIDPLQRWQMADMLAERPDLAIEQLAPVRSALEQLQQFLERTPSKKRSLYDIRLGSFHHFPWPLPPTELALAEKVYRRLYTVGGTGTSYAQEGLLDLIAVSQNPASIPFWLEILDWSRPRDSFTRQRRTTAVAALAYAAMGGAARAEVALRRLTRYKNPDVRALAVHDWGRLYSDMGRKLPPKVDAQLQKIAIKDSAFAPRFQACMILRGARVKIPLDNPRGVYAFKVGFKGARSIFSRTIELRAKDTLEDLHHAIQHAIGWDADHLYSFFMNGEEDDERYRFSCPYEEDRPPRTDQAVIGELGLSPRHKFLYLFDYGDNHHFEINVVDIQAMAKRGKYPRVTESKGPAPEQYPRYE